MRMRLRNKQSKSLCRRSFAAFCGEAVIFCIACALLFTYVTPPLYQKLAYRYADCVSPWEYVDEDTYWDILQSQSDEVQQVYSDYMDSTNENDSYSDDAGSDTGSDGSGTASSDSSLLAASSDMFDGTAKVRSTSEIGFWTNDKLYAVRNLHDYHLFLRAQPYVYIAFMLLGIIVISVLNLRRSWRRFDELAQAVTDTVGAEGGGIELPDSMPMISAEISAIRLRNAANARAAHLAEGRKNELVAYLAHDIRTPMTSVIGYLELLEECPEMPVEQRAKYIGIAHRKALRLEELVSEFFEITRYNLQSVPIERQNINLAVFCEQTADEFFPEAEQRQLKMEIDVKGPCSVFIDPNRMARALGNVLRNAIAYADAGTTIVLSSSSDDDGNVTISVTNHGREISPEHLRSIFDKFFREDQARGTDRGGAGLGLAIAHEIVEAHGGTIDATSTQGTTVFTIKLPKPQALPDADKEPTAPLRLLGKRFPGAKEQ